MAGFLIAYKGITVLRLMTEDSIKTYSFPRSSHFYDRPVAITGSCRSPLSDRSGKPTVNAGEASTLTET